MEKIIIGAGLAGLITACKIKDAAIIEAGPRLEQHRALLRFRDEKVAAAIGIPFKPVTVHKEISFRGTTQHQCSIAMANMYAQKVTGRLSGRSIWDLATVKRYVAPMDLYDRLVDMHGPRIEWNRPISKIAKVGERQCNDHIISTMPLPIMLKACGLSFSGMDFEKSQIKVSRYRMPKHTDVYQTVYFPDLAMKVFRASITGDLLIIESTERHAPDAFDLRDDEMGELDMVCRAMGIDMDFEFIDHVDQKYGKIIPLQREQREAILYELTRDFNVFSIGRFATWRNILLDDVVNDVDVVQRLMDASSYGKSLIISK